jgi:hypothetical protein
VENVAGMIPFKNQENPQILMKARYFETAQAIEAPSLTVPELS